MPTYRIYHVGDDGRLRLGDRVEAAQDDLAAATASSLLFEGQAAELWDGGRLVGRFSKTGDFTRGG